MFTTTKKERRLLLLFAIFVTLITSLPYLIGFYSQDANWRFTGFFMSVEDGNAFIGKMLAGSKGEFLFRTPYTGYPQKGLLIFITYILAGKLAKPPNIHEKLVLIYHFYRILGGMVTIFASYDFISFFLKKVKTRMFGLSLIILGGGVGWILLVIEPSKFSESLPLSFYSPESFGFLSLLIYPHYALARGLMLWTFVYFFKIITNWGTKIPKKGTTLGLLWLATCLAQPLTGMVTGVVISLYLVAISGWQFYNRMAGFKANLSKLLNIYKIVAIAAFITGPFIFYNLISVILDPFTQIWTTQSNFDSPNPFYYLLAYGLILPFACVGCYFLFIDNYWISKFPITWSLSLPILAYAPIGIQRRLPEGIWVAIVVLAMYGIEYWDKRFYSRAALLLSLAFPSTILIIIGGISLCSTQSPPVFRPSKEIEAFNSFPDTETRQYTVLASYLTSNALPAWAPVFVLVGHGPESIHLNDIQPQVEAFYDDSTMESTRIDFIESMGIDFIFLGPNERSLGAWDPHDADYLSLHFRNSSYSIYLVNRE